MVLVIERILETMNRYSMAPPGARLGVAVSGGKDSVCLLLCLKELAARLQARLAVLHFNHKLRGTESDADEAFVADLAHRLDLRFYRAEAEVSALEGNLEQNARRARRAFFLDLMTKGVVDRVALGHTRDDQAETVLFRLLRGSGLAGLAGILPVTDDGLLRPMIGIARAEVEKFLESRGVSWREDSTNCDLAFARNRIRHELLPWIERELNPRAVDTLAKLANLAYEEERWWASEIGARAVLLKSEAGGIEIEAAHLRNLPLAVARRLARRAIGLAKGDLRRIEFGHVESVLELGSRTEGTGRVALPGLSVVRSFGWIRLAPPPFKGPLPAPRPVDIPGRVRAPGGGSQIHFEVGPEAQADNSTCANLNLELCLARIPTAIELRGWRPGDHYRPCGESHDRKIRELFERARVPSWRRPYWPILSSGGEILWAREFGAAARFAAPTGTDPGRVLRIWETL